MTPRRPHIGEPGWTEGLIALAAVLAFLVAVMALAARARGVAV
jgi:hypothetical protein